MTRSIIGLLLIGTLSVCVAAQSRRGSAKREVPTAQTATTKDGRTVALSSDGTWKYTQPASPWDGDILQTVEFGGFTFDLKQALVSKGKVTIYMVVTPREANRELCVHTGFVLGEQSVMWDNLGNSYDADQTALANRPAAGFSCANTFLETPVRAWMTFSGVAEEAISAPRVKIIIDTDVSESATFDFRRVSFTRPQAANAQPKPATNKPPSQDQPVTIKDGRTVILKADGTWKYAENLVKPKSPWDLDTIQSVKLGGFTFDLKLVRAAGGNATLYFIITSHLEGVTLDILTDNNLFPNSLLFDNLGNRYVARRAAIGNASGRMEFIPEVPVRSTVSFDGIAAQADSAATIRVAFWFTADGGSRVGEMTVEFRRVPLVRS